MEGWMGILLASVASMATFAAAVLAVRLSKQENVESELLERINRLEQALSDATKELQAVRRELSGRV